jgi:hypothetical protein
MKVLRLFSIIACISFLGLLVFSCDTGTGGGTGDPTETADLIDPGVVILTGANVTAFSPGPPVSISITLNWTDPSDSDLASVAIKWREKSSPDFTGNNVLAGAQTFTIPQLAAGYEYIIQVIAKDESGNESDIVTFRMTPPSEEKIYHFIYTATDLHAVAAEVAGYSGWYDFHGYVLMKDVDISSYNPWTPIGSEKPFSGIFEGNGHVISGLTINGTSSDQGLFKDLGVLDGTIVYGSVKDLGVQGNVSGNGTLGLLAGTNVGVIENCYSTGSLSGVFDKIGGLVGINDEGIISDSYSTASVTGINNNITAGLVGSNTGTIENCHATGTVAGVDYSGGLVGENDGIISVSYATGAVISTGGYEVGGLVGENSGTIENSHATGTVSGEGDVGGLVGYVVSGTIANSFSAGNVAGDEDLGGLVGYLSGGGSISDCYSIGSVTGTDNLGGLIGYVYDGSISYCYSAGKVSGTAYMGGLIGGTDTFALTSCYYDSATSGQSDSSRGTPEDTATMKIRDTYVGWDFAGSVLDGYDDFWSIGTLNGGYPYLTGNAPTE